MRKQPVWRLTRMFRVARGLWPDHNPLRRPSDRAEAGIVAVLAAAFLIGAPPIALVVWQLTISTVFSTANAEHAGWRQVSAGLLTDAPQGDGTYHPSVPARWTAPDGAQRTGQVLAAPGARAGTSVTVWTSASGRHTGTPLSPFQAATQADLAAVAAVAFWG